MDDNIHLVSSLNQILEEGRVPLILIANDYSKDWISVLGANGYQGKLRNIPIVIPSSVVNHSKIISDISKCTNAVVFSKNCDNGKLLKDFSIDDLGHIKKAILTNQKILFIDAY